MSNPNDAAPPPEQPGALANMRPGDVLVTRPSAVLEHDISIVPEKSHATAATHREAIEQATDEAEARGVDAWVSEDHTHVTKLSTNRPEGEAPLAEGQRERHAEREE